MAKSAFGNSGGFVKPLEFKQTAGKDLILRILPSEEDLYADGQEGRAKSWKYYHIIHWGYKTMDGKARPFESPLVKNHKTKMIEKPDAAMERYEKLRAELEKSKVEGNMPLSAKLDVLVGFKGLYNMEKAHHVIAMDLQGNLGVFKLKHKTMLAFKKEVERLEKDGVYPLSKEDGRYFIFSKSGTGLDTVTTVTEYKQATTNANGRRSYEELPHAISDADIARLKLANLNIVDPVPCPSSEEVAQIVKESDLTSGKSPGCDKYLNRNKPAAKTQNEEDEMEGYEEDYNSLSTAAATVDTTTVDTTTVATTTVTASVTAKSAATPAATPATTLPKAQTEAETIDNISDDDFLKMING